MFVSENQSIVTSKPPQKSQKSLGVNKYQACQLLKAWERRRSTIVSAPWPQLSPMLEDLRMIMDDGNPSPGLPIRSTRSALKKFHAKMSLGSASVVVKFTRISQPESFGFHLREMIIASRARLAPIKRL